MASNIQLPASDPIAMSAKTASFETEQERRWRIRVTLGSVALFGIANLIVSIVTCLFAWKSYEVGVGSSEAQVFQGLRNRYYDVSANLSINLQEMERGPKKGTADWNALKAYWEQAVTEWYTTNKINNGQYKHLWANFYVPVLTKSLAYPAYRDVLYDMRDTKYYIADRGEFFEVMEKLCIKSTGKPLQKTSAGDLPKPK